VVCTRQMDDVEPDKAATLAAETGVSHPAEQ
jgi:hypothetical protein